MSPNHLKLLMSPYHHNLVVAVTVAVSHEAEQVVAMQVGPGGFRCELAPQLHEPHCLLDQIRRHSSTQRNVLPVQSHMSLLDALHCEGSERGKVLGQAHGHYYLRKGPGVGEPQKSEALLVHRIAIQHAALASNGYGHLNGALEHLLAVFDEDFEVS